MTHVFDQRATQNKRSRPEINVDEIFELSAAKRSLENYSKLTDTGQFAPKWTRVFSTRR